VSTGAPGDFRATPPGFAAPVFTHWAAVTPFILRSGSQFRPPPPAVSSRAYAAAINEVKSLGQDTSTSRTAEQTTIGNFWSAPIQNYWNAIAEEVAVARHDDIDETARTFALLDLGLADATIAMYDAKYTYRLWRPITAIRLGDTDGNPMTTGDPTWTPLSTTPADPSYPGAHSTLSAAAATVLTSLFGSQVPFTVTSPTLPGVTRAFDNFNAAASEAGLSRIYAGVHTRLDHQAGLTLGALVGRDSLHSPLGDDRD
jgi:membrane-associated phospholipid phosphatase